jgi:tetratricopeptide (TPR) repeat protein
MGSEAERERVALAVFAEALDLPEDEQAGFVADRTAGDVELGARVAALLAADATTTSLPDPRNVLPPDRLGPWRLDALIGAGGMGSVYRALRVDGLFEQTVAIKLIRMRRGEMDLGPLIDAERRLLAQMDHEGIARILDGGQTETGLAWFAMDFIDGEPLDAFADRHGLAPEDRVALVRQAAQALAHAHGAGVIHCDIKPDNILVDEEGRAKLIDFGIARLETLGVAPSIDGATRAYASPQRLQHAPATTSDDAYSLAVTLFQLLAGRLPWDGEARADPAETPLPLPDLTVRNGADLGAILAKALSPDPAERYRDAATFDADLQRWQEARPVSAVPARPGYVLHRLIQRRPFAIGSAVAASLALIAALAVISVLYVNAEQARAAADARFSELRALAGFVLFDLNDQLERVPGATPARAAMAGEAQRYLDGLSALSGDNPALTRDVATGLVRLAEVQGVPSRPNLGDSAAAEANLMRAIGLLDALIASAEPDPDLFATRARARYHQAVLAGSRSQDAARQLALARAAEADALAADPARPVIATLLLGIRLTQADALQTLGDFEAALSLRESEEQRVAALDPDRPGYAYDAGRAAALTGDSYYFARRLDDAAAAYRRAAERFDAGLVAEPVNRQLLTGLHYANYSLSAVEADRGDPQAGLAAAQAAQEVGERLVGWDPSDRQAQHLLHIAKGQVALMLRANGRPREALALIEEQIAGARAAAAANPDDGDAARTAVVALRSRAELVLTLQGREAGCEAYREALLGWAALNIDWPLSAFDRQGDVASIVVAMQENGCPEPDGAN